MNETLKVLETRRSCRNFMPDMVKEDEISAENRKIGGWDEGFDPF